MSAIPASSATSPPQPAGCRQLACSPSSTQDAAMEHRLTQLEVATRHIQDDLRGLRTEVRDFKGEMRDFQKEVRSEFRDVRYQARTDFRLLFGAIITVAVGMIALMAKGFHWV